VKLDDRPYRTLSPVTLLKAKLANYIEIPHTAGANTERSQAPEDPDSCIAGYLADAHGRAASGGLTERGW